MRSSTSSSDPAWRPTSRIVLIGQLLLTVVLLGAGMMIRPRLDPNIRTTGRQPSTFWKDKALTNRPHAVVLAGDSRGYRGLVPEAIAPALDLKTSDVLNFCFSGCAFDERYLNRLDELIDRDARPPILVLNITPGAFTPKSLRRNAFIDLEEQYRDVRASTVARWRHAIEASLDDIAQSPGLRAVDARVYRRWRVGDRPWRGLETLVQHFTSTGWVASRGAPITPDFYVAFFSTKFVRNRVSAAGVATFMDRINSWSNEGIVIVGVRMPLSDELRAVEDRESGMDWVEVTRRFESAGGIWFEVDHASYQTYDGSHLLDTEAKRFSVDLGERLSELPSLNASE